MTEGFESILDEVRRMVDEDRREGFDVVSELLEDADIRVLVAIVEDVQTLRPIQFTST